MTNATPPRWAEAVLRIVLKPADVDSVSGDLLEEYRQIIYPSRGQRRADVWYVSQVLGFVSPGARLLGTLLGASVLARNVWDWRVPTLDFHLRSALSTYCGMGLLLGAGFWAAWRAGTFMAGTLAGVAAAATSAVISIVGAALLLTMWHDAETMRAVAGSGGLGEVFGLPIMLMIFGFVLGTVGGVVGAVGHRWRRA